MLAPSSNIKLFLSAKGIPTFLILLFAASACTPPTQTTAPFPASGSKLEQVPSLYIGNYLAEGFTDFGMTVTSKMILLEGATPINIDKKTFNETYTTNQDGLVTDKNSNLVVGKELSQKGDSLTILAFLNDTLYNENKDDMLVQSGKQLFINTKSPDGYTPRALVWDGTELLLSNVLSPAFNDYYEKSGKRSTSLIDSLNKVYEIQSKSDFEAEAIRGEFSELLYKFRKKI